MSPGADAQTIAESVATPTEQQMSVVSGMNYMYSLSASSGGGMTLYIDYLLGTDVNTDQILAQICQGQANSQLPSEVTQQGVIVQPGTTVAFMLLDLYSPSSAYDNIFLANYATINPQYALTRISSVGQVHIFGAGLRAMRTWVNPTGWLVWGSLGSAKSLVLERSRWVHRTFADQGATES